MTARGQSMSRWLGPYTSTGMIDSGALATLAPIVNPVAERFVTAGHRLYLVGGVVRDLSLGRLSGFDIDFTTDALPGDIKQLVGPLADAIWSQGERFGTIGASIAGRDLEITTHRAERYDPDSRKPVVTFGDRLEEDLSRRDFTINAMAIEVPDGILHDPFGGLDDLEARRLRTPLSPDVSFNDDPLRMLRAARFISRFGLTVDDDLHDAAIRLADRLTIVSVERISDEIERLLAVDDPSSGLQFLRSAGLLSQAIAPMSEADAILASRLAAAPGEPLVRRAGLMWPVDAAAVLRHLRYSNKDRGETAAVVSSVRAWLAERRSSLADGRRLVARAGVVGSIGLARNLAMHLQDPATAASAQQLVDVLQKLMAADDVGPYQSPVSGADIMAILDLEPGPVIGKAQAHLLDYRLDHGPFDAEEAAAILRRWHPTV